MSGCLEIALNWEEGNALTELTGDFWVADLDDGDDPRLVYVSHSATPLAAPLAPVIEIGSGDAATLLIEPVLSSQVDSVARATDENGFILRITVPTGVTGSDQGQGSTGSDWRIYWRRRGVAGVA